MMTMITMKELLKYYREFADNSKWKTASAIYDAKFIKEYKVFTLTNGEIL